MIPPASITADDALAGLDFDFDFESDMVGLLLLDAAIVDEGAGGGGMAGGGGCTPFFLGDLLGGDGETMFAAPAPVAPVAPASSISIGACVVFSCAGDGSGVTSIVEVEVGPGASASCGAARCCCFFFCFLLGVEPEPPPPLDFFFDRLPISYNSTQLTGLSSVYRQLLCQVKSIEPSMPTASCSWPC